MDNPYKPYKMYVAMIVAFLSTFLVEAGTNLPWYGVAIITAIVVALGVYITPNPKV